MFNVLKLTLILSFFTVSGFCQDTTVTDTLSIKEKSVIFFEITQSEYDSLSEKNKQEFSELYSDFHHYRKKLQVRLENEKIHCVLTDKRFINILFNSKGSYKQNTFDRLDLDHSFGLIFLDPQKEPILKLGIFTDVDIWPDIQKYFNVK